MKKVIKCGIALLAVATAVFIYLVFFCKTHIQYDENKDYSLGNIYETSKKYKFQHADVTEQIEFLEKSLNQLVDSGEIDHYYIEYNMRPRGYSVVSNEGYLTTYLIEDYGRCD